MNRQIRWSSIIVALLSGPAFGADDEYSIKLNNSPPPKEVQEPIRNLLGENSVQLLSNKGALICEIWLRKEVPVRATAEQIKNGLTYREVDESTVLGAVRYEQAATDYRKQKIKPGVYTLRFGFQPMDGDHMGTAPYQEFCLLIPAKHDAKPDLIETKALREHSSKASATSHPCVLLLFPNEKPEDAPKMIDKGNGTWALALKAAISVDGKKVDGALGIALTLIGHSAAE